MYKIQQVKSIKPEDCIILREITCFRNRDDIKHKMTTII